MTSSRNVFFYHLKKCGGTSLNSWLDLQIEDSRTVGGDILAPLHKWFSGEHEKPPARLLEEQLRSRAAAAFHCSDVVHTHVPIRPHAPPGTFCFTVLREPVSRIVSQVADWRRLTPADYAGAAAPLRSCIEDAARLRLLPFLEKHGRQAGRQLLDNHLVRALAACRLGALVLEVEDAADLLPAAMTSLTQDFDHVGLTEQAAETRDRLCRELGWAPARSTPHLNRTSSSEALQGEAEEAGPVLQDLARYDVALYERARRLTASRYDPSRIYDASAFERTAAAASVKRLQGSVQRGCTVFSVRQPVIGHGFHGRDAARTPACAVWSGPETAMRLYMPAPAFESLSLSLWIRGYADERLRETIRVRVDDRDVVHRLEPEEGCRERLTVDVDTSRPFACLEVELERTVAGDPADPHGHDHRLRGLCFDRYGWLVR